ncbi:MAG: imidazolonepropionase [Cyanobacteria bacterium SZAS LIN-3]|nr:imidazolonepropionase [Cyanobacteria bacterium SZAS LIN-3]MBS2007841.1 imidazolonepropionase [Cyanobacteria bacterium SZAS TMP-1]
MPQDVDLLVDSIGELCTSASDAGLLKGAELGQIRRIKNAAIAARDGIIVAVGESAEVAAQVRVTDKTVRLDAQGRLVTPGLVDPHTHLIFDGNRCNEFLMRCQGRSYAEIAEAGGGIVASMQATRSATMDRLVALGRKRLAKMLASGTTSCEVKTGYGLDLDSELRMLAAIIELSGSQPVELVPTFMPAHAVPPKMDRSDYVNSVIKDMLPAASKMVADWGGTAFADVFCDRGYFTLEDTTAIFDRALSLGFKLKVHSDEFVNLGATTLAIKYGAASCDHLLNVSDEEIGMLAASNTVAVLLPGTSFFLNLAEHARARTMIDQGVAVSLGSDFNPGSCHIFSLPLIWGLACLHLKMTAAEALNAHTVNAAYAIGLGEKVGRLSPGYQADITIYDVSCLEEIPYNLGFNPVSSVIKRGVVVRAPEEAFQSDLLDRRGTTTAPLKN